MHQRWLKGSALALAIGALGLVSNIPVGPAQAVTPRANVITASYTGVVNPVPDPPEASGPGAVSPLSRGIRSVQAAPGSRRVPVAPVSPAAGPTPAIQANFNGVSSRDSGIVNFNQEFEPPDQGLCVGNGYVVELVNSAYRIYNRTGRSLAGPFNINDLFNQGALQLTVYPRCYYDPATNTWFATIEYVASSTAGLGTTSQLLVAVNSSGNPLNVWTEYQIDTTDSKNRGCGPNFGGCYGDQPTLGMDQNNLYVTTNEFGITSGTDNGAQLYAFAKSDLIAGNPVRFAVFKNLRNANHSVAVSVQPAITTGRPAAEYFLDAINSNFVGDHRIGVWALTNGAAVATGSTPTLSTIIIGSEPYAVPPDATQKGSTSLLNTGIDRMQQTQYVKGVIWGELDTALNITGDTATRSAAAWMAVRPTVSSGQISGATITEQGYVSQAGSFVSYPALQVDSRGNAAMVFTLSGTLQYPSAAVAWLAAGAANFGPVKVAAAGSAPYDPNAHFWGDYSWAVIDPTKDAFWLATEYIPPRSSQTPDLARNWGTRVIEAGAP